MKFRMQLSFLVMTYFLFSSFQISSHGQVRDIVTGKAFTISSKVLNESRDIMISLPKGYNTSDDRFPVLYLLDAESHFNYTAGVVEYLTELNLIPGMIIVGIPNTDRWRDFAPTVVENLPHTGGAETFLKFMHKELFPYIEQNYRTHPYRIMAGHSLCGMFSFYTMLNYPEYYNSFIGISPWVIYDNGYIVNHAREKLKEVKSLKKTFYFTAGSTESTLLPTMDNFLEVMRSEAPKDLDWNYKVLEGEDHSSGILLTIYEGLKYIYRDYALPAETQAKGLDAILQHYKELSSKYGYEIPAGENTLNNAAYILLMRGKSDEAINIFKKNVELHPSSANVYDSLGEGYERIGQKKLAKENYEKAYEIAKKESHPLLNSYKANFERASKEINN